MKIVSLFLCFVFLSRPVLAVGLGDELLLENVGNESQISESTTPVESEPIRRKKGEQHRPGNRYSSTPQSAETPQRLPQSEEIYRTPRSISSLADETSRDVNISQGADLTEISNNKRKKLGIEFKAGYSTDSSKSDLSYYDYSVSAPTVGILADFKFSESTSFFIDALNTPVSDLSNRKLGVRDDSLRQEVTLVGLRYREVIFEKKTHLDFGIRQSLFKIPKSATKRVGFEKYDLVLATELSLPHNRAYSSVFGLGVSYALGLSEVSSDTKITSGKNYDGLSALASFGGEINTTRNNAYLWELRLSTGQGSFEGAANQPDFISGELVSDAKLKYERVELLFGYRWGH